MNWLHNFMGWGPRPATLIAPDGRPGIAQESLQAAALAGLERTLDILTGEGGSQVTVGQRAEAEVRRYFGGAAVRGIQSAANPSGNGTAILAADRLLVTFLGRSAAMAITRKLYSDLK